MGNAGNVKPKDLERLEGIWNVVAQASSASVAKEAPQETPEVPGPVYTDSAASSAAPSSATAACEAPEATPEVPGQVAQTALRLQPRAMSL